MVLWRLNTLRMGKTDLSSWTLVSKHIRPAIHRKCMQALPLHGTALLLQSIHKKYSKHLWVGSPATHTISRPTSTQSALLHTFRATQTECVCVSCYMFLVV